MLARAACCACTLLFGLCLASATAGAQDLDLKSMILMPGPLIEAHAEEEKNCESCHSSFDKGAQDSLCLDCHEEVDADRSAGSGFHGLSKDARDRECKSCHRDHKGRDFNNVPLDRDSFRHQDTDFHLRGEHAQLACESCHEPATLFREAPGRCVDCHGEQDPHQSALGEECETCHRETAWADRKVFDHDATDFPLRGEHRALQCAGCHAGEKYDFENTECIACHRVDDVHLGRYGGECSRCHSEKGWDSGGFDHALETEFELLGEHSRQPCSACHLEGPLEAPAGDDCASCHASDDIHGGRNGTLCGDCHGPERWTLEDFDHKSVSDWPLLGKHAELSCLQCHRGDADKERGASCTHCHGPDDVHRSENMKECETCHGPSGWRDTGGFDHELTRFPLEGMHAITTCNTCHENHQFDMAPTACVECHREDDTHDSGLGERCESCHGPNGWQLASFDHGGETDFDLEGVHAEISCDSCHRGDEAGDVQRSCGGCHRSDDRHGGNFGNNCGRCHSGRTFRDVTWSD